MLLKLARKVLNIEHEPQIEALRERKNRLREESKLLCQQNDKAYCDMLHSMEVLLERSKRAGINKEL